MPIPFEFILFALTLLGVAVLHEHALRVALAGLAAIVAYKLVFTGFAQGAGLAGLALHFGHEASTLVNLLCLLVGFAFIARHFEQSELPALLPRYLPDGAVGAFTLLALVFVMSSFLDNIAAALIGGAMAHTLFRARLHIGYIAAIVAASNAGGAGSVIGDTTTTMMWIDGIAPIEVFHAYVAAGVALIVCGIPAALQQNRFAPILRDPPARIHVDWARLAIVAWTLGAAIAANVLVNTNFAAVAQHWPVVGLAVVVALATTIGWRAPDWSLLPAALRGAVFLLSLVLCASLMPVEALPGASWQTTLGLGFVSAVFDNIPLTALALDQGGYDWGILAFAVGFGGSMIWFGSSAGVAISALLPEAKSTGRWLAAGWHVALAYVVGFFVLLLTRGWHPT